jgi:hypothetical protein
MSAYGRYLGLSKWREEVEWWLPRAGGSGYGDSQWVWGQVLAWDDGKFWRGMVVMVAQQWECT